MLALLSVAGIVAVVGSGALSQPSGETSDPIRTEFRVFDGTSEVSAETRLRVRPAGSTQTGEIVDGPSLTLDLAPGIYDVQAIRQRSGQVVSVRWAEQLVIMRYPDEAGRHLEVINFTHGFGALQLRWPDGQAPNPAGVGVTALETGQTRPVPARAVFGPGYVLLVLPADTYDVRVTRPGRDTIVLTAVEIPPDRTRMKIIE